MKKRSLLFFSIILFVISIFSCPKNVEKIDISFLTYENAVNGEYHQYGVKRSVPIKTEFNANKINIPTDVASFEKLAEKAQYSFSGYWTTNKPATKSSVLTVEDVDEQDLIQEGQTLLNDEEIYAVYTKKDLVTITIKAYNNNSYTPLGEKINVLKGTKFGDIDLSKYNPPATFRTDIKEYFFEGRWAKENNDIEPIDSLNRAVSDGEILDKDTTLCAVYRSESLVTVKFQSYNKTTKLYEPINADKIVTRGTRFEDVENKPNVAYFDIEAKRYKWVKWTNISPMVITEEGTTINDIITYAAEFPGDSSITGDITVYAVYESVDLLSLTFNTYNKATSKYVAGTPVIVEKNTAFSEVASKISVANIDISSPSGDYTIRYTNLGWTEDEPVHQREGEGEAAVETDRIITGKTPIADDVPVSQSKVYYAIYENTDIVTVTFYQHDQSKYVQVGNVLEFNKNDTQVKLIDIIPTSIATLRRIGDSRLYHYVGLTDNAPADTNAIIDEDNVSCVNPDGILINKNYVFYAVYSESLMFKALEGTTISFNLVGSGSLSSPVSLKYRKSSQASFNNYSLGDDITLNEGEVIYFKGSNVSMANQSAYTNFKSTGKIEAYGGVLSLLNTKSKISSDYCFMGLFENCETLVTAPYLLSKYITKSCYENMFKNCTSLVNVYAIEGANIYPKLAKVAERCYASMFEHCTSLVNAPEIQGYTLAKECYKNMFKDCTSLTKTPKMYTYDLADNCYESMFEGCTSLNGYNGNPLIPLNLKKGCYKSMFKGCSSLTTAPVLSADNLAENCYESMFENCVKLTETPFLKAQTLVNGCYSSMFKGCSSLNSVSVKADRIPSGSTSSWLDGVSENGKFYCATGASWSDGASGIPAGWTKEEVY